MSDRDGLDPNPPANGGAEGGEHFEAVARELRSFAEHPPAEPTPLDSLRALASVTAQRRWWRRLATGVVVVAGGGLLGGVVGAAGGVDLVGERTVRLGPDAVPIFACPGQQSLGRLHRGDRVFATAVDGSGAWVRVRAPHDLSEGAWVAARWVVPDRTLADLPVVEEEGCRTAPTTATSSTTTSSSTSTSSSTTTTTTEAGPGVTTTPTNAPPVTEGPPVTTPTTAPPATATTTPSTTEPTTATTAPPTTATTAPATTAPTTAADTSGPSMSGLGVSPTPISESTSGSACPPLPKVTTLAVTVTDPSGVKEVVVSWAYESVGGAKKLTASGSSYSTTLSFVVNSTQAITLTVEAEDNLGNTTEQTTSVYVYNC